MASGPAAPRPRRKVTEPVRLPTSVARALPSPRVVTPAGARPNLSPLNRVAFPAPVGDETITITVRGPAVIVTGHDLGHRIHTVLTPDAARLLSLRLGQAAASAKLNAEKMRADHRSPGRVLDQPVNDGETSADTRPPRAGTSAASGTARHASEMLRERDEITVWHELHGAHTRAPEEIVRGVQAVAELEHVQVDAVSVVQAQPADIDPATLWWLQHAPGVDTSVGGDGVGEPDADDLVDEAFVAQRSTEYNAISARVDTYPRKV